MEPLSGTHTNTQEGLWYHVKRTIVGTRNLEMSLIYFMFRRKFHATGGNVQLVNCYTDLIDILYNNLLSCFYRTNTNPVLTIAFRNKIIR